MNLAAQLEQALPPALGAVVREAAELADHRQLPLYLVGGPVRDLILGRANTDLDLVAEGDAIALARACATRWGGTLTTHAAFGTATVLLGAGTSIDFVTARRETYPHPAALPIVMPATIADDLRRRDFTINTLALSLAPHSWGDVLDPVGGVADLHKRLVRVLHDRSFVDDPTRILRAIRFAARLDYGIEAHTRSLLALALPYLEQTSSARILHELRLLLREVEPERVLQLHEALGSLPALAITWQSTWGVRAFEAARAQPITGVHDQVLLGLLAPGELRWPAQYPLTVGEQRVFKQVAELQGQVLAIEGLQADDALDQLLQPFDTAALLVLRYSRWENTKVVIALTHYLNNLRPIKTLLTGDDLRVLGLPPGPQYRKVLAELRAAQLRGVVTDRRSAEAWVYANR
ncbi:MAG: CCA tRNA nucleotidyltransferase [Herpetosiphonaceae bacterium]|nr:CCA tRNA nucleotidyltransferase [Herpetosiphonaceae bacterium]